MLAHVPRIEERMRFIGEDMDRRGGDGVTSFLALMLAVGLLLLAHT